MEKAHKISTSPYKGTTDAYPQEMVIRNHIFDNWKRTAKLFGYEEYDTPMLENTELYRAKSGDEIANNQLYSFTDKGGHEVAIRPEMTPSLARMVAAKRKELSLPIRWFNISKYYRYEKPQKGRRREFFQMNIDILGVEDLEAELEIFQYILSVMDGFNAPKETYEIRVSSRYLLDYLFKDILNLEDEKKKQVGRAIDNYTKMEGDEFVEYLKELGLNERQIEKISDFLKWTIEDLKRIEGVSVGAKQLIELFDKAKEIGLTNIRFEPSIMRGLLYYTGTVIEMYDIGGKDNPRALLGGGRYDDLLSLFGEEKLPAFGFAWGDIVLEDYLRTYNLIPDIKTDTKVYLPLMDKSLYNKLNEIASELRNSGINTELEVKTSKLGNQLKYCSKKNIPWTMIVGEDELKNNTVQLKNMLTGDQQGMTLKEAILILQS